VHTDAVRRASATEPASADERDVALQTALPQTDFAGSNADNFGGFPTNFSHPGPGPGCLERVPYGTIHVTVGALRSGWGVSPLGPWMRSSGCTTPISTASGRSGAHVTRAITTPGGGVGLLGQGGDGGLVGGKKRRDLAAVPQAHRGLVATANVCGPTCRRRCPARRAFPWGRRPPPERPVPH
jgi:hypothetical protein